MTFFLKYVNFININPKSNKKIISYCLYSIDSKHSISRGFYKGVYVNYMYAKTIYPDYIVRIYMPYNEPSYIIEELSCFTDIELILIDTNICLQALRFLPYDDKNVDVWLSRDLDSIVNEREKEAVNDWLSNHQDKELHIMSDNPQHYWIIAGGLFGFKNSKTNLSFIDLINNCSKNINNVNDYANGCVIAESLFYKETNYIQHHSSGKKLLNSKSFLNHVGTNVACVGNIENVNKQFADLMHAELCSELSIFSIQHQPSIMYWKHIESCLENYKPVDKYIILNPWDGGFNNVRMSFEIAASIALYLNRTLVITENYKIDHLTKIKKIEEVIDFNDLGINIMKLPEFCEMKGIENNWENVKMKSTVYKFNPDECFINLDGSQRTRFSEKDHRKEIFIDNDSFIVLFDKNLLGNVSAMINCVAINRIKKYVCKHIHYKEELFVQACKIATYLNIEYGTYFSLHIRRNDFQTAYKNVCIPYHDVLENIRHIIPKGACLYISTDVKNKQDLHVFCSYYKVIVLSDVAHLLQPNIHVDMYGMIEQIICSRSKAFVGNHLSTFSTYIYRLRGCMKDIYDKSYYIHNSKNKKKRNDMKTCWNSNDMIWSREFEDSFSFNLDIHKSQCIIKNGDEFYYEPWIRNV